MAKLTVISGRGPDAVFESLMRPHFDALYGRAYRLSGNKEDAEDLVQDLCVRVYPRVDELRGLDNPRAWLMRVLYRLFVDLIRSRQRSPLELSESYGADDAGQMASSEPGPEEHAEGMLAQERLERAWRYLDDEQRLLLALQGIEGHSLAEIETITGIPQGTLKSRLHRARARLGRLLEREENLISSNLRGSDCELPRHCGSAR